VKSDPNREDDSDRDLGREEGTEDLEDDSLKEWIEASKWYDFEGIGWYYWSYGRLLSGNRS
jgi:hypothetical protein